MRVVIDKLLPLLSSSVDKIEHISKSHGSLLDFGVMSVSLKLQRLTERNSFTLKNEAAPPYVSPPQK